MIVVENSETQKYCSLYVNEMHLVVMLTPYVEKEVEKGNEIITILDEGLENEVNTIMKKINLGKSKKAKMKKIRWGRNLLSMEQIAEIENKVILVKGNYNYIKKINSVLKKNNKVINCFDIDTFEDNSREILENHFAILNTSGERKISEMFGIQKKLKGILTK